MVFTGIVEEMGEVVSVERKADLEMWDGSKSEGFVLKIKCKVALQGAYIGCSIAVNGTCLTVTQFDSEAFEVNCAPETLRRTDLGDLKTGDLVNLERSMAATDRNSGHFVQGHVDEAGKILKFTPEGDSLWVRISLSDEILPFVIPKGYIAVDGTSLTVCEATDKDGGHCSVCAMPFVLLGPRVQVNRREKWFNLMLIAHTQKCIVIPKKKAADRSHTTVAADAGCCFRGSVCCSSFLEGSADSLDALQARNHGMLGPRVGSVVFLAGTFSSKGEWHRLRCRLDRIKALFARLSAVGWNFLAGLAVGLRFSGTAPLSSQRLSTQHWTASHAQLQAFPLHQVSDAPPAFAGASVASVKAFQATGPLCIVWF
ncbi:unnamed protein product [Cladocopium goreaui]|uniref:Riboflavin synthase (RS) n=1 Tax=Cladocopium goreaui TaxID=2562237 RepID=A0A9P1FTH1_9DINO|nr:unnamed protein product [Cladocopium goreaui]